jgi:AraC-like DNA-binding protein
MPPDLLRSLDWSLRGGACAVLLLTAGLLWRDSRTNGLARLGIALALSGAAFAISSMAGIQDLLGPWRLPFHAPAAAVTVVLWMSALRLFDDDFRLKGWHGGLWGGVMALCIANGLTPGDAPAKAWIDMLLTVQSPFFALLAAVHILMTWRGDLVERRRSARAVVFTGIAIYSVVYTVMDAIAARQGTPEATRLGFNLVEAAGLLAICLAGAGSLLGTSEQSRVRIPARAADTAADLTAADRGLLARLEKLMSVERLYRRENLSIGTLAAQLGLPEYKLRRLINRGLGHRNFASFVNGYRLNDAKAGLADPQQAQVPILTIALDAGFASLGPFNRAFKAETGLTPTEFRASALKAVSEQSDLSASRISNST